MGLPAMVLLGGATLMVSPTLRKETADFGKKVYKRVKEATAVLFSSDEKPTKADDDSKDDPTMA